MTTTNTDHSAAIATHLRTLDGTYDRAGVRKLAWPVAWNGRTDETDACDAARAALVRECLEALDNEPDAHEIAIEGGRIGRIVIAS